ncbi:MAG: DUF1735 domain-containing protein, partial [Sphingobacteriales bacterium]
MKFNYLKKSIIPALSAVLLLSSCLKDDNINQDFTKLTAMVGIADASPSGTSPNSTSVGIVATDASATFNLVLTWMSDKSNPGTAVTLKLDGDVLDELNEARGTDYELLTAGDFEFPTSITIPAGATTVNIPIKLNPTVIVQTDEDIVKLFALPIQITAASGAGISENFGRHVLLVSIKNKYDGTYQATGIFHHPTAGDRPFDFEKVLATTDPTTVETTVGDLANFFRLSVDDATNEVTYIGEISPTQPIEPVPGLPSTYDPA